MAIRIPILTSFDPKGLRQANAQFAKLQTSMGSLGRNFAAAGVVIAGALTMIGKSVMDAAESQKVFAQTEAVLKSTGTTANGTASQIAKLAASLQKSTAFNDEAILSGQNLLLTFKGVRNEVGEGNDIFNQASTTMLDFARAMKTGPEQAAIKLGKALQDPTRGVTALRKSGVDFTKDQIEMIKSLQESGDLMGAQKIVLAELQSQFGGSAAAYAKTFTGQLESMNNELNDLSEEIGLMVMPAVQGMITEFRNLIPIIGPQLKAAIESVDWASLTKSVVDLTTFILQNAQTIANLVIGIFALNTAYKLMVVTQGLFSVALELNKWWLAQTATGMTTAAIATGAFSTALKLIPFVAIAAGLGLVIAGMVETDSSYRTTTPVVTSFGQEVLKSGQDAEWAAGKYGVATDAINKLNTAAGAVVPMAIRQTASQIAGSFGGGAFDSKATQFGLDQLIPDAQTKTGGASATMSLAETLKREAIVVKKQAKLIGAGVSEGLAARLTSGSKPVARANKALKAITANNGKLTKNLRNMEKNLKVVADAAVEAVVAAEEPIKDTSVEDAIAAKERAYASFADSVKNTFGSIKDSILGAFDITQLGGSTDSITRNMDKLLVKLRSFSANVKSLATMGLNPALLQQVISAGPVGGSRLAEALVMGGAGGLSAINAGYSEFGNLSGQIAQSGTESLFGTATQQSIYNISVDGGVGSGSTIGKAIVDAIKAYERTSGAVFQGA
jgi:hypothetical protein